MYQIQKNGYGYKLTFSDFISAEEMKCWADDSKITLQNHYGKFGVLVDMRTLKPLNSEAQEIMVSGQKVFKEKGMERSAVILSSALVTGQFKRLAQSSGIYQWERYIDASTHPDFEKKAEDWIRFGSDPDK